jgi:uncharacterized protein (TIGR02246 family)
MKQAPVDSADRSVEESAIRTLYQRTLDAWNQGDGFAFAEPMAEDADFIAFDGTHFKGRRAIGEFHDPLLKTHLKGTRLVGKVLSLRFLSNDVALLHVMGGTIMRGASTPHPGRDSIQTLVLTREEHAWHITAFQNTRVRPIGRNHAGTIFWLLGDWFWKFVRPKNVVNRNASA